MYPEWLRWAFFAGVPTIDAPFVVLKLSGALDFHINGILPPIMAPTSTSVSPARIILVDCSRKSGPFCELGFGSN